MQGTIQSEHRYSTELKTMLNTMREGIIFISCTGQLWLCNERANQLLNKNLTEGANYKEGLEDNFFGFSLKSHLKSKTAPKTALLTISSPRLKHLEIITSFVPLTPGSTSQREGLLIVIRDLTSSQLLHEQLSRQERLESLGKLAASLAHEIRNPLTAINGFARLLKKDLLDNEKHAQLLDHIIEGARAVEYLVSNMLDYAKPLQVQIKTVPIATILNEVVAMAIASNWALESEITCKLPKDLTASCDPHLLKASLLNLIRNSSEAMASSKNKQIKLEAISDEDNQMTLIKVTDCGEGIAEENQEKIFSPFYTTKVDGTGLGLSQVDKMIRAQGGSVQLTSKPGEGCCFTIALHQKNSITSKTL